MSHRFPKQYLPKQEEGMTKRITGFEELNLEQGSWLFLAQAKFHLNSAQYFMKQQGRFFKYPDATHSVRLKVRQALKFRKKMNIRTPGR